jgi:hypothetical protein
MHPCFPRARIHVGSLLCRIGREQRRCTQARRSDGPSPFAGEHSRRDREIGMSQLDDPAVSKEIRDYPGHERFTNSTGMW